MGVGKGMWPREPLQSTSLCSCASSLGHGDGVRAIGLFKRGCRNKVTFGLLQKEQEQAGRRRKTKGPRLGRVRHGPGAGEILLPGLACAQSILEVALLGHRCGTPTQGNTGATPHLRRKAYGWDRGWCSDPGEGYPGSCSLPALQHPSPVTGIFCHEAPNPHHRERGDP